MALGFLGILFSREIDTPKDYDTYKSMIQKREYLEFNMFVLNSRFIKEVYTKFLRLIVIILRK